MACEFSGIVRDAFRAKGHEAYSVDLVPTESDPEFHIIDDAISIIYSQHWDMLIAFPPCTYLANSSVSWLWVKHKGKIVKNESRWENMEEAVKFFIALLNAPIDKIAIENPLQHGYAIKRINKTYTQKIQPWQFGHGETKTTCLWLKNLPMLKPTNIVSGRNPRVHFECSRLNRWKERSKTFQGIAEAMAEQWN